MKSLQDVPALGRLWKVAEQVAIHKPTETSKDVFAPIGLHLDSHLVNGGYYCTPTNTTAFAWTGGDGVHFSFVHIENKVSEQSPIVMTVPLGTAENVIVGTDLIEFLRLGCTTGYAALEELDHDRKRYMTGAFVDYRKRWASHHGFATTTDEEDFKLLQFLIDEFSLTPWDNVEQRLDELEKKVAPLLDFMPEYRETLSKRARPTKES